MPLVGTRRYRAPDAEGALLLDPPAEQLPLLVARNQALAASWAEQGLPLAAWRQQARAGLAALVAAHARCEALAGVTPPALPAARQWLQGPLLVSGHQPGWFHPGVWFKNFLVASLARQLGGLALHVIVDNDIVAVPALAVPSGTPQQPQLAQVLLDRPGEGVPWEDRPVLDPALLASVVPRIREQFTLWPPERGPLLAERMQPYLDALLGGRRDVPTGEDCPAAGGRLPLGLCLAIPRHALEREAGLVTYEVTISQLARTEPFGQFVDHLCQRADELQQVYNAALAEYRRANRVRSRSHPVPALERDGPWIELPLWIWNASQPHRRRAFVRPSGMDWQLSDRQGVTILRAQWLAAAACGEDPVCNRDRVRIRPRALLTTLYARLMLSDLFVHGIGGAKYDEMTDQLLTRLWGIEPPAYGTATATFRLPLPRPAVTTEQVRHLAWQLRELQWHPERFVGHPRVQRDAALAARLAALAAEKREYLRTHRLRRAGPECYAGLARIDEALRELLRPLAEQLRGEHAQAVQQRAQARWLGSREYSFALFGDDLPARLLASCPRVA